jgi:uncharacterized protein (DUF1697 family)
MQTYVALLRGINVGGHHKLPMKELRSLLANLGLQNVRSYIASGNVVFQADGVDTADLEARISAAINQEFGFGPRIMILTAEELAAAAEANPFPQAEAEPKTLHLFFLAETAEKAELEGLAETAAENERFELKGKVFYLYTPDGVGRSKLAERMGRFIPVDMTARNWRTVSKLLEMVGESE